MSEKAKEELMGSYTSVLPVSCVYKTIDQLKESYYKTEYCNFHRISLV